jgi:hypothetical protein
MGETINTNKIFLRKRVRRLNFEEMYCWVGKWGELA